MENIKIAEVCGLCAGCKRAINTAVEEIKKGNNVTIFKEIVHNKNVNAFLSGLGAKFENQLENLSSDDLVIIRAHGEPPKTYEYFNLKSIKFKDCTCFNVEKIHGEIQDFSDKGFNIIIIGKHKKEIHPEVYGTIGWAKTDVVLIEDVEDVIKLGSYKNERFYLVCQTTFNMNRADELIQQIKTLLQKNKCEIVINRSICSAQQTINEYSAKLAKQSDVMIVVGGVNSSNTKELFNNMCKICPSIFIENIYDYQKELKLHNLSLNRSTKVGITAGASTRKEELFELKNLIIKDLESR